MPRSRTSSRTAAKSGKEVGRRRSARLLAKPKGRRNKMSVSSVRLPMEGPKEMEGIKFNRYIRQLLKNVQPKVKLDNASMKIMDSIVKDTLHRIATTASDKMGKKKTIKPRVLLKAMKKLMPKAMVEKVDMRGQMALVKYKKKRE